MTLDLAYVRGFDFHCHVDLHADPASFVRDCERERIFTLSVTTTPKAWPKNKEWAASTPYVVPAVGLHPELVGQRYAELPLLISTISESPFVGEVGLDGSPQHRSAFSQQREVFAQTLKESQRIGGRVLTIHSRRAANEVIELIEQHTTHDRVRCILHWFSGSASSARKAAAAGCFFSVNGRMLDGERGQALVSTFPPDRIVTETDAPFAQEGERASLPWDVMRTSERLAALTKITTSELNARLAANAARVLRFAGVAVKPEYAAT